MPFATLTTGARLHYEDLGSGTPLIAVHGWMGTARYDMGSAIDWLAKSYHVYGVTKRGYGASTPKPRTYPHDFYARDSADLIAFMDAAGIEKAHLLGYSDGGESALIAAGTAPERFYSVATIGAVGSYPPGSQPLFERYYPPTWVADEIKALHGWSEDDVDLIVRGWIEGLSAMATMGGDISHHLAPHMHVPVLMMLGEQDTLNPAHLAKGLIENAPDAALIMFTCGHPIHQQQPERFQQIYGSFLNATEPR